MAVQPTDPSIINFLTSRGFIPSGGERAPLFTQRKGIFESLGLGTDFRGEAGQNTAILNKLAQLERDKGVQLNPTNLTDFLRVAPPTPTPTGTTPTGTTTPPQVPDYLKSLATQAIQQGETPALPSVDETARLAIEKVTGGATFPLQQEAVEAERSQVKLAGQRQAEDFIRAIASRGFTPATGRFKQGVLDIEVDTLAKTLNVDRRFAMLIATGLQSAAQDIVKQAQKEIDDSKKEGKEKRTEARDALKALGYVIDPGTGTLIRTETSLRGEKADIRAEENQRIAEERLRLSEESGRRAEERLAISQTQLSLALTRFSERNDLTPGQALGIKNDFADTLIDIPTRYSSQDEALADIKRKESGLKLKFGQEGYNQLVEQAKMSFPAPVPVQSFSINQAVTGFVDELFKSPFR